MIEVILLNILLQLIYFVGIVFFIGFLISLCNRLFYKIVNQNKAICYVTGFLGTPIHELSHALFCLIFFHKIDEIKLFQIDDANGVLGYVKHSYNKKNPWALLGNYFIGVAPIITGSALLFVFVRFLLPNSYSPIAEYMDDFSALLSKNISIDILFYAWAVFEGMVVIIATDISAGVAWWGFVLVAMCIALHMNLSGADIKGALPAIPIFAILIFIVNIIIGYVAPSAYQGFLKCINFAGSFVTVVLFLALIFSLMYVAVGGLLRGGVSIVKAIKLKK